MANVNYLVEMRGIVKRFPGVLALDHVDFTLKPGEVHVLLGENGAGKSTLVRVLSGAYSADEGEIFIQGEKVYIDSPEVPLSKGLRFIYQELSLVPDLDIARNIFLGTEPSRSLGFVDVPSLYQRTRELLERLHVELDPYERIRNLSVTEQKMVEIARALVTKARAIVLDEPTDVLESRARENLFTIIRNLKEQGVGFVYISHRYAEVYELGDQVTILRDGKNVGTFDIKEISFETMIEKMIGRKMERQYLQLPIPREEEALKLEAIHKEGVLKNIHFSVKKGEIISITGLMGSGKTELARVIAGVDPKTRGIIYVEGEKKDIRSPSDAIRYGISFLTENRKSEGLILDHTVRNNYGLTNVDRLSRLGWIHFRKMNSETDSFIQQLNIKTPSRFTLAGQLSGGNQQKLVLAKWLGTNAKVIIFDEPTRGVDILGRRDVYHIILELAQKGTAIIVFTSDYTEALEISHRILIMRRGEICKEFKRGETTEEVILKTAIGGNLENCLLEDSSPSYSAEPSEK